MAETKLKIRAKTYLVLEGIAYQPGAVLELPEREALGLVGTGDAEQIPAGAPDKPEAGTAEQVAEANDVGSIPDHEDPKKAQQLEEQAQKQKQQPKKK